MQCFSCFTDAQRGNPHLTHGLHLDNPAKQKDTSISQHQSPDTCSPVSNCSEDSHVTSSSGSGSSDGGHYAADVSSWQVRDQVLSSQQDRPSKVRCSKSDAVRFDQGRALVMRVRLVQFCKIRM
jgi:hypothetical protein